VGDLAAEVWMDESTLGTYSRTAVRADKRWKEKKEKGERPHDEYSPG
jgi:hypothetical protein